MKSAPARGHLAGAQRCLMGCELTSDLLSSRLRGHARHLSELEVLSVAQSRSLLGCGCRRRLRRRRGLNRLTRLVPAECRPLRGTWRRRARSQSRGGRKCSSQYQSAMVSGAKCVPGATSPAMVTVAACTPCGARSSYSASAHARTAALPTDKAATAPEGSRAKPPPVNSKSAGGAPADRRRQEPHRHLTHPFLRKSNVRLQQAGRCF